MPKAVAKVPQVLPSPPTDEERDIYFKRNALLLAAVGVIGALGAMWATGHMAISHHGLGVFLPFLAAGPFCVFVSVVIFGKSRDERRIEHRTRVLTWRPSRYPSVDIWLPVCGEPLEVLANAWSHTGALQWPGRLRFHVADDADQPEVRTLAQRHGFAYHVRPDRGHMKKSGNLRYLYQVTSGEFAVVFDADFCPRRDFLDELMPYFDDPKIGIVQSPQYFRVLADQHWLERGAGAVQEFFYRTVQTARQQWGGSAICVGTNAIYRRAALDDNGGTTLIEHSEDVHTGFDLRRLGWNLRYVPTVLATGICPSERGAYMRQQYRWCSGSMSLTFSRKFWQAPMSVGARCCYLTGLGYYASTAVQALSTPALALTLLLAYPHLVRIGNYAFLAPALLFSYLLFPLWHRCHWGIEAWTARLLYGWAHLFAITDLARGRPMGWTPTGARTGARRGFGIAIAWSLAMGATWVALALYRFSERPLAFLPLLCFGLFYLVCVARVYTPPSWSLPKPPPRALRRIAVTALSICATGLASPLASSARGAELGITGTRGQYAQLRSEGLPLDVFASWLSWRTKSPDPFLASTPPGAQPMINWEPSKVSILGIADGAYDRYITRWARAVAAYRAPILIRFAQEMNGTWFSWSRYGPGAYVAAWRHIVTLFRRAGASNARFIWSPDGIIGQPSRRWQRDVVRWYPGADYVDYVGMSMVAFKSNIVYGEHYFFTRLDFLHHTFANPVVLPEMKVTEASRYGWLESLKKALHGRPWVQMVVWSETSSDAQKQDPLLTGQMDWSLIGDPRARALLALAVAGSGS